MTRQQFVFLLSFESNHLLLENNAMVVLCWVQSTFYNNVEASRNIFVCTILPWKHLVKKFIGFGLFALQLSCSFINNSLQVVCVFFHHGEHVVYDTNGSERKKEKRQLIEKIREGWQPA